MKADPDSGPRPMRYERLLVTVSLVRLRRLRSAVLGFSVKDDLTYHSESDITDSDQ